MAVLFVSKFMRCRFFLSKRSHTGVPSKRYGFGSPVRMKDVQYPRKIGPI